MSKNIVNIVKYLSNNTGFEKITESLKFIKAENGHCLAEYTVKPEHANFVGSLHGGYSATLVDVVSSFALFFTEKGMVPSVSTDMHLSYLKAAKIGEEVLIEAKVMKCGKALAYLNCEIKNKITGDLLVRGSHTKFLMSPNEKKTNS